MKLKFWVSRVGRTKGGPPIIPSITECVCRVSCSAEQVLKEKRIYLCLGKFRGDVQKMFSRREVKLIITAFSPSHRHPTRNTSKQIPNNCCSRIVLYITHMFFYIWRIFRVWVDNMTSSKASIALSASSFFRKVTKAVPMLLPFLSRWTVAVVISPYELNNCVRWDSS